ncbi:Type I restriction-modification system, specificity subunit S [Moraxella catarrhalis]|nr:Type I restriction-modification system, specificity subunit S [Moraxella catarrhalis]
MKNISKDSFSSLIITIPKSKPEQTAIATALSDTDALLAELEKLLAKKQAIKTATMQQLLTGKTRLPEFAHRADGTPKGSLKTEWGDIPEDWEVVALGDVGNIITGSTPSTIKSEFWNGDIAWITPTDISECKDIYYSERQITEEGLKSIRELPANTLLVTCIASIGKNAILRNRGSCNQQINAVIPNNNFNVDFLYYFFENKKPELKSLAGITATPIISKALFSTFLIFAPDKLEQIAIAQILGDMDNEINALQARIEKLREIKQGMMQNLLTGKIRLLF